MKRWKKPVVLVLSMEQLSRHIKVAARSGCGWVFFR